ncbi:SRPBCC family protein [Rhizohabitans arisaemae]|uniref:SRPBCC family protein n=1 Tax=Rhizohabitans arisaemae TaxID=2720610 RepID=UPI0024B242DE|nr:SRPBCC family protein [Rhizohabitans arisaemae]
MNPIRHLAVSVVAAAPAERVFELMTDWPRHRDWMFLTDAEVVHGDGHGPGSHLAAFTGLGGLGFLDTMEITHWDPPHEVRVRHLGRVVRGHGAFRVVPEGPERCRITWEERLELPLGVLGEIGWVFARPVAVALLTWSLNRLAHLAAHPCP